MTATKLGTGIANLEALSDLNWERCSIKYALGDGWVAHLNTVELKIMDNKLFVDSVDVELHNSEVTRLLSKITYREKQTAIEKLSEAGLLLEDTQ